MRYFELERAGARAHQPGLSRHFCSVPPAADGRRCACPRLPGRRRRAQPLRAGDDQAAAPLAEASAKLDEHHDSAGTDAGRCKSAAGQIASPTADPADAVKGRARFRAPRNRVRSTPTFDRRTGFPRRLAAPTCDSSREIPNRGGERSQLFHDEQGAVRMVTCRRADTPPCRGFHASASRDAALSWRQGSRRCAGVRARPATPSVEPSSSLQHSRHHHEGGVRARGRSSERPDGSRAIHATTPAARPAPVSRFIVASVALRTTCAACGFYSPQEGGKPG